MKLNLTKSSGISYLMVAFILIGCSGKSIEGEYVADFSSYQDPIVKRTGILFKNYDMHVTLKVNQAKAIISIKGMGIDKQDELKIEHLGKKIKIQFPLAKTTIKKENKNSKKSTPVIFEYKDKNTIICRHCTNNIPLIWRRKLAAK